ncbi:hypothetical protein E3N88_07872 [Mikania micrantha]|uniref:Uncharacterized protein n=1 Tax=Mikania micrantha TaxID=192012 RepID=A0A5N6PFQ0_9ASTR|nr:hypothetical protein E3N88_07872 [Mikania micrantha]
MGRSGSSEMESHLSNPKTFSSIVAPSSKVTYRFHHRVSLSSLASYAAPSTIDVFLIPSCHVFWIPLQEVSIMLQLQEYYGLDFLKQTLCMKWNSKSPLLLEIVVCTLLFQACYIASLSRRSCMSHVYSNMKSSLALLIYWDVRCSSTERDSSLSNPSILMLLRDEGRRRDN